MTNVVAFRHFVKDGDPDVSFISPRDGIQALLETLEDMGYRDCGIMADAIAGRLNRKGYAVSASERIKGLA